MINNANKLKFNDFYESYYYLQGHKICNVYNKLVKCKCNYFKDCLSVAVVRVNPKTSEIDDKEELNTKTQVWLEFGGWDDDDNMPIHDIDLDTGADTFEEAIINLANLVWDKYKDERI